MEGAQGFSETSLSWLAALNNQAVRGLLSQFR
jgi:hypothetical protein